MLFQLDHIVHVTGDPLDAVKDMQKLGFHALAGGEHENWGTQNGLCYFGLTYIEFLGIKHLHIAEKVNDNTLITQLVAEREHGLARLALRVNNIDKAADHFKRLGVRVIGPVPGSRKQLDGSLLEWAMLFIEDGGSDRFRLPFIIDWKRSDTERKQQLTDRGLVARHPVGDVRISDIVLPTSDLDKAVKEWKTLFGAESGTRFYNDKWNAQCVSILLNGQHLTLCEPLGNGIIGDYVESRGERPFSVSFTNTGKNRLQQVHGANYNFHD
ncbi:MAG: VOC family protein [Tuberibacillus sp.]